ncbi:MAG: bifunctional 5,10-methylenetetrahydrofolate dehydrogenase/5,10-methenyltetrahydrofolate cyclohydrolase [Candidatus Coatesbacteria bacterium]|nr:MAG: bifunctional 5,10-methylenetetrahydrofolate dehydrogenase/5,10-methenyltetrahydrofolate cyclohydrolase [Candidatus Coatesbacteria bacterium]
MTATIVDGKEIAAAILGEVEKSVAGAVSAGGRRPHLAIVVADDPAALSYTKSLQKKGENVGVEVTVEKAAAARGPGIAVLSALADDPAVDAVILQRPFIDRSVDGELSDLISPTKDVDGQSSASLGALWAGRPCFPASTAAAAVLILEHYDVQIEGAEAVVVGRSTVVGKPAAALLLNRHATVTICHTRTKELAGVCKRADIVIAAAGRAGLVTGDMVKPGAAVIDCGYNFLDDGTVVGDAVFDEVAEVAALTNKAVGGVGPITTAILLKHVAGAAVPTEVESF